MNEVLKSALTPTQKLVALVISYHANGGAAVLSLAELSAETSLSVRGVQMALRALEKMGALETRPAHAMPSSYRVSL